MSLDDSDELAYLWTKVKFIQKYMSKHDCNYEVAEREFHIWIEGLMDSRIEPAKQDAKLTLDILWQLLDLLLPSHEQY